MTHEDILHRLAAGPPPKTYTIKGHGLIIPKHIMVGLRVGDVVRVRDNCGVWYYELTEVVPRRVWREVVPSGRYPGYYEYP